MRVQISVADKRIEISIVMVPGTDVQNVALYSTLVDDKIISV